MIREFRLPDVGEGLTEATIVDWLVGEGDAVALNQPLCNIETEKAEVELPSPYAGTLVDRVAPGEILPVGTVIARFEVPGSTPAPADGDHTVLVGYGVEDAAGTRRRRSWDRAPAASAADAAVGARPRATPPVRKLARELEVDLDHVTGTGPDGAVTRQDVVTASRVAGTASTIDLSRDASTSPRSGIVAGDVIPVSAIRARIARRMSESRSTIPDAAASVWVDCGSLMRARDTMRADAPAGDPRRAVTPFTLLLRLVVLALERNPLLNATYDEDAGVIRTHADIHLGIATDSERGLLVPVIHHAQQKTTLELATESQRLAVAARAGTLAPTELTGSTFSITNFGALGLDDAYPIINHPDAAILGVGTIADRPMAVDGQVVVRPTAKFICSFDHRLFDGGEVGAFLRTLRELVEQPALLLLSL